MAIKSVIKMGNEKLITPALPVTDFNSVALENIIVDMKDTMREKNGVGIAAPQIGYSLRIIMLGFEKNSRYPNEKPVPFTIFINPIFKKFSDQMVEGWEKCLSVPGLRGLIPRYQKIYYEAYDILGKKFSGIAEGFHARIIQHECDHIDGILFPQRIKDLRYFGFDDELIKN